MRRECRERFPRHRLQRKPLVNDPGMHHGTCVTHVPWCMSGSLTRRWREKRSRHSRRMRKTKFYESVKRPMRLEVSPWFVATIFVVGVIVPPGKLMKGTAALLPGACKILDWSDISKPLSHGWEIYQILVVRSSMEHNQMRNSGSRLLFESEAIYKNYAGYPVRPFTQVWVHLGRRRCHWAFGASF